VAASEELESGIRERLGAGDRDGAVTLAIRGYGPEILGFLTSTLRNPDVAAEVFSQLCEDLWNGIAGFRGESSLRTWAYVLARHAAERHRRDPYRRRAVPLSAHSALSALEAEVRESTATHQKSEVREAALRLRRELDPDDQTLLVLRIDRRLPWDDVARVFAGPGASSAELKKQAAALRKRFERLKTELKKRAVGDRR
jgi:RNA polymerase sigma-70 factor (ECF subfamily)